MFHWNWAVTLKKNWLDAGHALEIMTMTAILMHYIVNLNDRGVFLRNNKGNQNNWMTLKLIGTKSNRDGIGARVKVTSGGKVQTAQKKSTSGYLSQNDPRMHFGLAKNQIVDRIEIKWPSGKLQVLENIKVNQILTVKEPQK